MKSLSISACAPSIILIAQSDAFRPRFKANGVVCFSLSINCMLLCLFDSEETISLVLSVLNPSQTNTFIFS